MRCVADPFKPSRPAALLESRFVLGPESNIARALIKFPFLFITLTFCAGQKKKTSNRFQFAFLLHSIPLDVTLR